MVGKKGWQPGESGNPNGRPKIGLTLADAVRGEVDPREWARVTWARAKEGSVQALEILAERGWGKAPIQVMLETTAPKYDLGKLTDEELAIYESLTEKLENDKGISALTDNPDGTE